MRGRADEQEAQYEAYSILLKAIGVSALRFARFPHFPMTHICPKCSSENIQHFRVVYEGGTGTQVSTTSGVGVGVGRGGIGLGVGGAKTQSTTTSLLAQRVAPPQKKKVPAWIWLVGLLLLGYYGVGAILLAVLLYRNYRWNKTEWVSLYQQWEKSWLCQKCGHTFAIDG